MHSDVPLNSAAARRARWVQAQRAALHGPPARTILRHIAGAFVPGTLLLVCIAGLFVRLLAQDRVPGPMSYFYYAVPPAVLGSLACGAGLWWLTTRRRLLALPPLALGSACLIWAYASMWVHNRPPTPTSPTTRVLFWNVAHGSYGWPRVINEIRRRNPDIIALVEAMTDIKPRGLSDREDLERFAAEAGRMETFWCEHFPGYTVHVAPSGIALFTRVATKSVDDGVLARPHQFDFGRFTQGTIQIGAEELHLVVVDVGLDFRRSYWPAITCLQDAIQDLSDRPVLIVGDFNLPADSAAVAPLRSDFANAFETVGNGYAATWPVPLPLLAIDQAWYNRGVHVVRCDLGWSWASDHRCIELDIELTPPAQ